jgi:hypothetical protein
LGGNVGGKSVGNGGGDPIIAGFSAGEGEGKPLVFELSLNGGISGSGDTRVFLRPLPRDY